MQRRVAEIASAVVVFEAACARVAFDGFVGALVTAVAKIAFALGTLRTVHAIVFFRNVGRFVGAFFRRGIAIIAFAFRICLTIGVIIFFRNVGRFVSTFFRRGIAIVAFAFRICLTIGAIVFFRDVGRFVGAFFRRGIAIIAFAFRICLTIGVIIFFRNVGRFVGACVTAIAVIAFAVGTLRTFRAIIDFGFARRIVGIATRSEPNGTKHRNRCNQRMLLHLFSPYPLCIYRLCASFVEKWGNPSQFHFIGETLCDKYTHLSHGRLSSNYSIV